MSWCGYYKGTGGPFTSISASWVVPTLNVAGSVTPSNVLIWVGMDGVSNNFVEQCGVAGFIDPSGTARWQAWAEFNPANEEWFSATAYPVSAGDSVTASTSYTTARGGTIIQSVTNTTRGWSASAVQTLTALTLMNAGSLPRASVEVVVEADQPENTMADFGSVTFTGITGLPSSPTKSTDTQATVTSNLSGSAFTVGWVHS